MFHNLIGRMLKSDRNMLRKNTSRGTRSCHSRGIRFESLEDRRLLAAYNWNGTDTLLVNFGSADDISVTENAGNVRFTNVAGGGWGATGVSAPTSGNDGTFEFIEFASADIANSLTIFNVDSFGGNDLSFDSGVVTSATVLVDLSSATATMDFDGGAVSTSGDQTYSGAPITLSTDTVLTSTSNGAIRFSSTVDGGQALTVNTGQSGFFDGAVGSVTPLASLTTTAGADAFLNGGGVTTTGAQTYGEAVILGADTTIETTGGGGAISFGSTVNSDGTPRELTTSSDTAETTFAGAVGNTSPLKSLLVFTPNNGTVHLNGGSVQTTMNQAYFPPAPLLVDTVLTGSEVAFFSQVDGTTSGQESLTIMGNFVQGNTQSDAIGGSIPLELLSISGTTTFNATANPTVTTTGDQTYTQGVTLQQDTVLTSTSNGAIRFSSTVDGGQALTVNTGQSGFFDGAVGSVTPLASLTTTAGADAFLNGGGVTTTGAQTYGEAVILGADTTIETTGGGGAMSFGSTVNSDGTPRELTTSSDTAETTFAGAVGNTSPLKSLLVFTPNNGTVHLNGGSVQTTMNQAYFPPALLSVDTLLTGSEVAFFSQVDGTTSGQEGLTIMGNFVQGNTQSDAIGGSIPLELLSISGTTTFNATANPTVTTTGDQTYTQGVTLQQDTELTSTAGLMIFGDTVDSVTPGNFSLDVTSGGANDIIFQGAVGSTQSLGNLTATAGRDIQLQGSSMDTAGFQSYDALGGAIDINADLSTSGAGTVDLTAARNIALTSGSSITTVDGAITLEANTAGTGTGGFHGVSLVTADITSTNGAISLAGRSSNMSSFNGVSIGQSSTITSTGTGTITIDGTGGSSSSAGVHILNVGTQVTSLNGNIQITGNASTKHGVWVSGNGVVESTGTATITIDGTTTSPVATSHGVLLEDGLPVVVTSLNGDIQITGAASAGIGVRMRANGVVESTGTANIAVTGSSTSGTLPDIEAASSSIGGPTAMGAITFTADSLALGGTTNVQSSGALTIQPRSAGRAVNLGTGALDSGLQLDEAELALLADGFSSITIGGPGIGFQLVEVGPTGNPVPANLASVASGAVAFAKDLVPGFPGTHEIMHLNDGNYGNSNSWIGNSSPTFGGIDLGASGLISQIAFGRDNLGGFTDRDSGTFTLQYTTETNPDEFTANWTDVGTITSDGAGPDDALRHLYQFDPVMATGVRIVMSNGGTLADFNAIDEIEVYGLSNATGMVTVNPSAFRDDVTIVGGDINVTGAITNQVDESITLAAADTVTVSSSITSTGAGAVNVIADRNIALTSGSSITTVDGAITLEANTAGTTAGTFVGIDIITAASVASTTGAITLTGKGGDTGAGNHGVQMLGGATVSSTGSAMVNIAGTALGNGNGVRVLQSGTQVTSLDGDLLITGVSGTESGVFVAIEAEVSSTGAATVTINGTGAVNGVLVEGLGKVTTQTGNLQITGNSDSGDGVEISFGAEVSSTDTAMVTIDGTSTSSSLGAHGVRLAVIGTQVSTVNGVLEITGTSDGDAGIRIFSEAKILATGGADVTIIGDSMALDATVNAMASGSVTLRPLTNGTAIDLGGADAANTLGLTDAELDRITAGTLVIGNATTGDVTFTAAIAPANAPVVHVISGGVIGDTNISGPDFTGTTLNLSGNVNPGASPGIMSVDGDVQLADNSTFTVEIGGTSPGTGSANHDQLHSVNGTVSIGNVTLSTTAFSGFVPTAGQSFKIIDNDGTNAIVGTFVGLAEGALISDFLGSGLNAVNAVITYAGGDGNDVVILTVPNGDFNNDGIYDGLDIDALVAAIAGGTNPQAFDLTGDGRVDLADRDAWLAEAGTVNLPSGNPYILGDANLDGSVDVSDFNRWNSNKFTMVAQWTKGDFNADGSVDVSDFNLWNSHKFTSADSVDFGDAPGAALSSGTGNGPVESNRLPAHLESEMLAGRGFESAAQGGQAAALDSARAGLADAEPLVDSLSLDVALLSLQQGQAGIDHRSDYAMTAERRGSVAASLDEALAGW